MDMPKHFYCGDRSPPASLLAEARTSAGLDRESAKMIVYRRGSEWARWESGKATMDAGLWELWCLKVSRWSAFPERAKSAS